MLILKRVERQKEGREEAGKGGTGVSGAGRRGEGGRGQQLFHPGKALPAPGSRKSGVLNTG